MKRGSKPSSKSVLGHLIADRRYHEQVRSFLSVLVSQSCSLVRGLSRIRDALLFAGEFELDCDRKRLQQLVDSKFQLLVGAQIFGTLSLFVSCS